MKDRVLLEILSNRFMGIARELGHIIKAAGHTVFVKETADFGAYLVSPLGEVFMTPDDMGIFITIGTPMDGAIDAVDDYQPGDICITNDPEGSRGLVTHLPDFFLWKPVFAAGRLICFCFSFIHSTDVGGLVPGSVSPTAVDQFQEGLIVPPSKLFRGGELNRELLDLILANSRVPDQNWGDLKAQVSALNVAERRFGELFERYGVEPVEEAIEGVLAYSEEQARSIVAAIPDGTYTYWDYLEADFTGDLRPIRIKLDLTVEGSDMTLDFGGSDPQVPLALNMPTHGKDGHNMLVPALVNYFRSRTPEITYNSGMMRPVRMVIPRGNLLNPEPRAPSGARQATMFRVPEVIMGALAQAVPDHIPACGGGQGAIMLVSAPEFETGDTKLSIIQPLIGGSGGRPGLDGTDGVDFVAGFYRNIPTETLENDMPILIERYGLLGDGGGPGEFRGGLGLDYAVRVLSPRATLTCRAMERTRFRPWGRAGGHPGRQGFARLRESDVAVRELGKIDVMELHAGEVLEIGTPCGGGFGDPLDRDPGRVAADVSDGYVGTEGARELYGVVMGADGAVAAGATRALRERLRRKRPPMPDLAAGPEREEFESRWTDALQTAVHEVVWTHPPGLRAIVKEVVEARIRDRFDAGEPVHPGDVAAIAGDALAGLRRNLYA
jgi:N-methylhydantoinase B